jgi:hypothetical protein
MTTIEKILSEIKLDDFDLKMKKICDDIMKEEQINFSIDEKLIPKGSTILLSLECPKDIFGNITFLCLERDLSNYTISKWILKKERLFKQSSSIIPFSNKETEKLLSYYAKNLKILREGIKYV